MSVNAERLRRMEQGAWSMGLEVGERWEDGGSVFRWGGVSAFRKSEVR